VNDIELNWANSDASRDRLIVELFGALGAVVESGDSTTITLDGQPVATIVPVDEPRPGVQIGHGNVQHNVFT
jgi:hypothetical protein